MYTKEDIQCILCQSGVTEIFYESRTELVHSRNVVCTRCGLVFVSPRLKEEEYIQYYEQGDYVKDHYGLTSDDEIAEVISWRGRRAKEKIACFPNIFSQAKEVLEIGAGTGVFLDVLRQSYGARVFGIEPAKKFADIARQKFGIDIFEGTLRSYQETHGTSRLFDMVVMDQVLEHLYNPLDALKQARNLLQKNGYLYVGVPNVANPKHPREEFFIGPHIYTFSPWTITLLLWRAGLKVVELQAPPESPMYLIATHFDNPVPMFPIVEIPGPFATAELARRSDSFGKA